MFHPPTPARRREDEKKIGKRREDGGWTRGGRRWRAGMSGLREI